MLGSSLTDADQSHYTMEHRQCNELNFGDAIRVWTPDCGSSWGSSLCTSMSASWDPLWTVSAKTQREISSNPSRHAASVTLPLHTRRQTESVCTRCAEQT